jgi:hypothetical protein
MILDKISILKDPIIKQFIVDHLKSDAVKLLLNPPPQIIGKEKTVNEQIISRQKADKKLPEWYQNPNLIFPPPLSVEQASSTLTSTYKSALIKGNRLIDLTGGMGVDCLALSKNFESTIYVEKDAWLSSIFQYNSVQLGANIQVVNTTAEQYITDHNLSGSTIYLDPARRSNRNLKLYKFADTQPNVLKFLHLNWDSIWIKASPMMDINQGIKELQWVSNVYLISVKDELKEILFQLTKDSIIPDIHCIELYPQPQTLTRFKLGEERANVDYTEKNQEVLFDLHTTLRKAMVFDLVPQKWPVHKLAPNTHLYTGKDAIDSFPGRQFRVIEEIVNKKTIKRLCPDGKINVILRNYGSSTQQLKKELKVKDGGNLFLIGFRDNKNKRQLRICTGIK